MKGRKVGNHRIWAGETVDIIWDTDEGRLIITLEDGSKFVATEFFKSPAPKKEND